MQSQFYATQNLTHLDKIAIVNEAITVNTRYYIDKLDCSSSYSRQRSDMTFDEILDLYKRASKFDQDSFVFLRRYDPLEDRYIGEIGFSLEVGELYNRVTYFLFVYLNLDSLNSLIKKFNLQSR